MKRVILSMLIGLFLGTATCFAEEGTEAKEAPAVTARALAEKRLDALNWREGPNPRSDGKPLLVFVGYGETDCPADDPWYAAYREKALSDAMNDAVMEAKEYIGGGEGAPGGALQVRLRGPITSVGYPFLQTFETIETSQECAIITVLSGHVAQILSEAARGRPLPTVKPNKPLEAYLPKTDAGFLKSIGVRMGVSEKGEPFFLSYGRCTLADDADGALRDASFETADLIALEQLVRFAGGGVPDWVGSIPRPGKSEPETDHLERKLRMLRSFAIRERIRRESRQIRKWKIFSPTSDVGVCGTVWVWEPNRALRKTKRTAEAGSDETH